MTRRRKLRRSARLRRVRRVSRRSRKSLLLVFALLFGAASTHPARAACVEYTASPLISGAPFRPTAVAAGDLDGDGDLDAVVAARFDLALAWYENDGGGAGWTAHTISSEIPRPRSVEAVDVDTDGDLDVLTASHYLSGGEVSWFENDGSGGGWSRHVLSTASSQAPWRARAADLDRDGSLDVLVPLGDSSAVVWFDNSTGDGTSWVRQTIDATAGRNPVDALAADLDGDGDADAVAAAYVADAILWFANDGDAGGWTSATIAPSINGPRSLAAGDLDRDGDLDLLAGARAGSAIVWYRNSAGDGSVWSGVTVSTLAAAAYSVALADLDGDGDLDALSASVDDDEVVWHENDGAGSGWTRHTLTTGADFANAVATGDLDLDGDADVLATAYLDNALAWYRNDRLARGALIRSLATLSDPVPGASALAGADLDRDGDPDLLVGSEANDTLHWLENPGDPEAAWSRHTIGTVDDPVPVVAADVDGDGDLDAVTSGEALGGSDLIIWFVNDGTPGDGDWARATVSTIVSATAITTIDLDRDGDLDIVSATATESPRGVFWFANDGTPLDGGWTLRTLAGSSSDVYQDVVVADLDGDGDLDIASGGQTYDVVFWLENDGTPENGGWIRGTISTDAYQFIAIDAGDIDGDGDIDLVSSSHTDQVIAWHENVAPGDGSAWARHTLSPTALADQIELLDLDRDGDLDLVSLFSSFSELTWYVNDGSPSDGVWERTHLFRTEDFDPELGAFAPVDLDGDGDLDLAAVTSFDSAVRFRNDSILVHDDGFDSDASPACWSSSAP